MGTKDREYYRNEGKKFEKNKKNLLIRRLNQLIVVLVILIIVFWAILLLHSLKLSVAVIALLAATKRKLYLDDCDPLIRTRYGNLIRLGEN